MKNLFDVAGKVIVLTGGAGRLGRHYAETLLARGARVAVVDVAPAAHGKNPKDLLHVVADVTKRRSLEDAAKEILKRWKRVPDGLVNNAALDSPPDSPAEENGPLENYPVESWKRIMDVNANGVFLTCQVFGGAMARAGRGSIVNVSSIYANVSPDQRLYAYRSKKGRPFFKPAAYSASKSALSGLTRYLATYWARRGVRVNTLTLGGVLGGQDPRFLKGYESRVPLGRMARPGEYDAAVIFLLSEASSYMTGSELVIDGGWTAW